MQDPVTILCMKWGTLYSADYVNVLYRACVEHTTRPFKFVCLTDTSDGIDPDVTCLDIPDLGLTPEQWRHGAWAKLGVFSADLYGLTGRALFIDLDTVLCGPLDDLFDYTGDFVGIDTGLNWKHETTGHPPLLGTGIFAFTLGSHPEIVTNFLAAPDAIVGKHTIEQVFVQDQIDDIQYWPKDWVISFKYQLRQPPLQGIFKNPRAPQQPARIVAFHGDPRPINLVRGGLWGVFPHLGVGKVKWVRDYWTKHGGAV